MAKTKAKSIFVCKECGANSPKWLGKCPSCEAWSSYYEKTIDDSPEISAKASFTEATPLSKVDFAKLHRIKSDIDEFDTVLGGGIVPSSLVLIGGDPGIGKSTLLTSVAGNLAKNYKVLYASAEESNAQVKIRCNRMNINSDNFLLLSETCLENIENNLDGIDFLIIDSIQAIYLESVNSQAGSISQVRECASRLQKIAKTTKLTIFIVGHVTKDGNIAGPKTLEHIMDTVLYFEGESVDNYRILRAVKNRFGAISEVGVFEMRSEGIIGVKDYSGIFISENRGFSPGAIVTPSISGNRCVPIEIQSLVSQTIFGMPRRMPLGLDYNKLVVLLAVLEKRAGVPFYNQDVYANVMGGIKISEPSVDLALCLSCTSSQKGEPINAKTCAFGEVGLTGEVRGVTFAEKRVNECVKLGFNKIFVPKYNYSSLTKFAKDIEIIPVSYARQAINTLFPK